MGCSCEFLKSALFKCLVGLLILVSSGCVPPSNAVRVKEVDPVASIKNAAGLGIESKDIAKMTSKMSSDIIADPHFRQTSRPPTIIIDNTRFINESNQMININMLVDRLRIYLMRSAKGRLHFKSRENLDLALNEKIISGIKIEEADYWLVGRISSLSTASNKSGIRTNFLQFTFEILDLSDSSLIWGNIYEVKKVGADDTIYR